MKTSLCSQFYPDQKKLARVNSKYGDRAFTELISRQIIEANLNTELKEIYVEFVLSSSHKGHDVCDDYAGKTFNLMDEANRPILPSEGKGYSNGTHPECGCKWRVVKKPKSGIDTPTRQQQAEYAKVASHIKKAAKYHTLHTVKPDGSLSQRTRGTNPMNETINSQIIQAMCNNL